ncbi:SDR family NAD(P)-dependent oxidoreductase [Dongshaea marina]|uniref:SDR family NAD(P)-dependent oxidoreductase n=1 Tax=Dongshaea marina TaxID=2047966 RepID=UPI000D3E7116|nr:SDR family oxidoreductase [Dongshaea marina]
MKQQALVTGASRGIGLAVAEYLAGQGYDLLLVAKHFEPVEALRQRLQARYGAQNFRAFAVDLADVDHLELRLDEILSDSPPIDLLFNCAGVLVAGSMELESVQLMQMLQLNTASSILVANRVAQQMKHRQRGYIFNVSSLAGVLGVSKIAGYAASKAALLNYSRSLFKELLPHDVRVTCLCPSVVNTDMTDDGRMDNESKIQVSDLVKSVDYLLSLGDAARVERLDIYCKPIALRDFPS